MPGANPRRSHEPLVEGAIPFSRPSPVRPLPRSKGVEFNVHVVARFRPPVTLDEQQDRPAFFVHPSGRSVDSVDMAYHFELDRAFSEDATQEAVYDYVGRPIVTDVLDGYNGTIFAYGHTGSGKTYCMFGPEVPRYGLQGVVPRTAEQIFDHLAACADERLEFTLRCSFLEVYREQMRDLLDPMNQGLSIKELPQRGLFVDGLTREYVTCAEEVLDVLRQGNDSRAVTRTRLNEYSSRSHAIFVLHVEQRAPEGTERLGKLTLVDLAGSEKVGKSGAVGETLEEAKKINWSLSALGKVIDALAEQRPHVPYRDSRLTRVLQEALGGNCRTTLLVAASACSQHYDETLSSMRFATRAKKVKNRAKVNYMYSSDQLLHLVAKLQRELASAHCKIAHLSGIEVPPEGDNGEALKKALKGLPVRLRRSSDPTSIRNSAWNNKASMPGQAQAARMRLKLPLDTLPDKYDRSRLMSAPVMGHSKSEEELVMGSDATSCGSARSLGSPRSSTSETSHSGEFLVGEFAAAFGDDEAWRPLAIAARDAVRSLEAALVAQEQALEQAGLLRVLRDTHGVEVSSCSTGCTADTPSASGRATRDTSSDAFDFGQDGGNLTPSQISERWRTLRHAVDARSLHWRLQLERHRSEQLALELEMRKRHTEELERTAEKTSARLARLLQEGSVSGDGKGSGMHTARNGHTPGTEASFEADSPAAHPQFSIHHPRIARPVRCGSMRSSASSLEAPPLAPRGNNGVNLAAAQRRPPQRSFHEGGGARGSSASSNGWSPDKLSEAEASSEDPSFFMEGYGFSAASSLGSNAWVSAAMGSTADVNDLKVAGTGDTGEISARRIALPRAGTAELRAQFERYVATTQVQLEGLHQAHSTLQGEVNELRSKVDERGSQLVALAAELSSRDVRVTSLQHEVRVKDALLSYLREDSLKRAAVNDDEIERLVEQAMSPLTTVLTNRQGYGSEWRPRVEHSSCMSGQPPMPVTPVAYC